MASPQTRVLLVEDSELNRDLLRRRLVKRGFSVDVAVDGLAGYEAALASKPDVVLLDMSLPRLSGWEAAAKLREEAFRQPIIGLTAHALSDDRKRALDAGCDAFITKPVDFDHLVKTIAELADAPSDWTRGGNRATSAAKAKAGARRQGALNLAVGATLAEHAHSLNNARAPLLVALELGERPELMIPLLKDADEALAMFADRWTNAAAELLSSDVKVHSGAHIATVIASALGVSAPSVTDIPDSSVRVDEVALSLIATTVCQTTSDTRVKATVETRQTFPHVRLEVGPLAKPPRPKQSAVASVLRQLHTEIEVNDDPPSLAFLLLHAKETT